MSSIQEGVKFAHNTISRILDWEIFDPKHLNIIIHRTGDIILYHRDISTLRENSRNHTQKRYDKWLEICETTNFSPTFPVQNDFEYGMSFVLENFETGNFIVTGELTPIVDTCSERYRLSKFCYLSMYRNLMSK